MAASRRLPAHCPVLSARGIQTMFARPAGAAGENRRGRPPASYYGCGWYVRPIDDRGLVNTWHGGSLDGTESLLVRRADGIDWAVLFNTREDPAGKSLAAEIESRLGAAADAVRELPAIDLFHEAGPGKH
jgi:hypothetical protein